MNIIIAQRLKELRAAKGNTQEDLAEYLSISVPSVSKWERAESYPDITFLPRIAAFYNVSVDDLLGVGEIRKQERLDYYMSESQKLKNVGKIPEAVALWREAIREFPNEHRVISELADAIYLQRDGGEERLREVIALAERILKESTDQRLRDSAIRKLCFSHKTLGDMEKSKEYANMASGIYSSKDCLLSSVLQGEEGERYNKEMILEYMNLIGSCTLKLNTVSRAAQHEFYLKLLETLFDDGFYGFYATRAARCHCWLAMGYASRGDDEDKVRYHLEQLARFSRQFDSLDGEYTYTCTMLKGLTDNSANFIKSGEGTECESTLEEMRNSMFDKYREKDWFREIISSLTTCAAV